jgi:hypothetical protein
MKRLALNVFCAVYGGVLIVADSIGKLWLNLSIWLDTP